MVLGGLWHGAAWSYAVWGAFHGLALAAERLITNNFKIRKSAFVDVLKGIMVFTFVTFAWLLFKLPDFSHVIEYFRSIFRNVGSDYHSNSLYILLYSAPVVLYHFHYLLREYQLFTTFRIKRQEYLAYGAMLFMIITNSGPSGSFIYFQF
jgi:alginate O-acetyltransferase complex protein AlgI